MSKSGVIVVLELRNDLVVGCGGDDATDDVVDDVGDDVSCGLTTVPILLRNPALASAFLKLLIAHPFPSFPIGPYLGHCAGGT